MLGHVPADSSRRTNSLVALIKDNVINPIKSTARSFGFFKKADFLHASQVGDVATIKRLLSVGVDVHMRDPKGKTPLHLASESRADGRYTPYTPESIKQRELGARELITYYENPNVVDYSGNTPLHLVLDYNSYLRADRAMLLLNHPSIDINKENSKGDRAIDLACIWEALSSWVNSNYDKNNVVEKILMLGANPNDTNSLQKFLKCSRDFFVFRTNVFLNTAERELRNATPNNRAQLEFTRDQRLLKRDQAIFERNTKMLLLLVSGANYRFENREVSIPESFQGILEDGNPLNSIMNAIKDIRESDEPEQFIVRLSKLNDLFSEDNIPGEFKESSVKGLILHLCYMSFIKTEAKISKKLISEFKRFIASGIKDADPLQEISLLRKNSARFKLKIDMKGLNPNKVILFGSKNKCSTKSIFLPNELMCGIITKYLAPKPRFGGKFIFFSDVERLGELFKAIQPNTDLVNEN